ncbi:MAG TPA: CoB--CoM heterodisulfide reductase iron-sulfur subunit A family protein [Thermoleophilia bacterium]|nr:CoB--CoM heterodisulfide reductase iron-sulfur subunit A family protein [Thermoleophilia bacterium]HQG04031.1 CoB--CoM heterodisulfide reductase iron-sulfur subunit A family protein [Thermoleophilia bacterium]HQG53976.1 CoB--CoM heterodisulfide reductase iron-sulfur subunit A family protein [Thermoleophilia bacterium]HQJ98466.1 CoB--CoM heterodisulfide reductase iron-sulfur subunit A family protein [Thermoleophilia bacterium]
MAQEKIGVYVCHCGTNIAGKVDVEEVTRWAAEQPNVAVARNYKYMCSDPGQDLIKQDIKEHGITRAVVAACSPTMHEPTFRKAAADGGLNPYLLQMANIREHCSWVTVDGEAATAKAKRILGAQIHRLPLNEPLDPIEVPVNPNVMVVGGGIAGIEAALKLAQAGKKVYLVERDPSIGGHMAMFDKTFPTLDCAACILTPKMSAAGKEPHIEMLAYSEVTEVEGYVGNFKVKVRKKARYVDIDTCTGCGLCTEACVVRKVPNEFDRGLSKRAAAYIPFPQAVPLRATIDPTRCLTLTGKKCKQPCLTACGPGAIDFDQKDEEIEVEVGAIIVATGFELWDPTPEKRYSYGKLDNVLSSLEFERISNASGPTGGHILCKNGEPPKAVAILHCVGSRDENYQEFCSRVCCMYSLKFAHLIKEHLPECEVYECYIDMRTYGKGYEEFYKRLMNEDVHFIRGRAAEVTDVGLSPTEEGRLVVKVEDTLLGITRRLPVDMVILSSGLAPRSDAKETAQTFGFGCSANGFYLERHPKLEPVSTVTDGIFIAGCCQYPKDIPDTVAQAGAAAAGALALVDNPTVNVEPTISYIDPEKCSGCHICVGLCPHAAIQYNEEKGVAEVITAACKGCGVCVAACASGVPQQRGYLDEQIFAEIEGALAV